MTGPYQMAMPNNPGSFMENNPVIAALVKMIMGAPAPNPAMRAQR
jgi:hypothetical protein